MEQDWMIVSFVFIAAALILFVIVVLVLRINHRMLKKASLVVSPPQG